PIPRPRSRNDGSIGSFSKHMKTPPACPRAFVPFSGAISGAQRQAEQSLVEGCGWTAVTSVATESTAGLWATATSGVKPRCSSADAQAGDDEQLRREAG